MGFSELFKRLGGLRAAGGGDFAPIGRDELSALEDEIGATLPEPYRALVSQYGAFTFNGRNENNPYIYFHPKTRLPGYITKDDTALFDFFYGTEQADGPLSVASQVAAYKGRIPETMIPIGGDGGAGQICLGVKGNDKGMIFYWDSHNEPLDEETYIEDFGVPMPLEEKRKNIHLIADSFSDFLDRLEMAPV